MYKKNRAIVLKDARGNVKSMLLSVYDKKSTREKSLLGMPIEIKEVNHE